LTRDCFEISHDWLDFTNAWSDLFHDYVDFSHDWLDFTNARNDLFRDYVDFSHDWLDFTNARKRLVPRLRRLHAMIGSTSRMIGLIQWANARRRTAKPSPGTSFA
jgi:hypothetical protein